MAEIYNQKCHAARKYNGGIENIRRRQSEEKSAEGVSA